LKKVKWLFEGFSFLFDANKVLGYNKEKYCNFDEEDEVKQHIKI
jgi:hypothetical protein